MTEALAIILSFAAVGVLGCVGYASWYYLEMHAGPAFWKAAGIVAWTGFVFFLGTSFR